MTTQVSPHKKAKAASIPQVSHLTEVAETIRDDALELAQRKLSPLQRNQSLESLLQNPAFWSVANSSSSVVPLTAMQLSKWAGHVTFPEQKSELVVPFPAAPTTRTPLSWA